MTLIWPHRVYRCLRKKSHERSHNTYTYVSCIQYTKFLSLDLHSFPSERCPFGRSEAFGRRVQAFPGAFAGPGQAMGVRERSGGVPGRAGAFGGRSEAFRMRL